MQKKQRTRAVMSKFLDPKLEKAYNELDRFSWDEVQLRTYDQAEKYAGAYRASLAQKIDEGEILGRGKEKEEVAKRMLAEGFELPIIAKIAKLPVDAIEQLLISSSGMPLTRVEVSDRLLL